MFVIRAVTQMELQAVPNPAIVYFNFIVRSSNMQDKITLMVYNQLGQLIEIKRGLVSGQEVQIGAAYKQGTYFLEMQQGDQRKTLQVVKSN